MILPSFIKTHRILSPSLRESAFTTSEGTVVRLREPRMVMEVSLMCTTSSRSIFMSLFRSLLYIYFVINTIILVIYSIMFYSAPVKMDPDILHWIIELMFYSAEAINGDDPDHNGDNSNPRHQGTLFHSLDSMSRKGHCYHGTNQ